MWPAASWFVCGIQFPLIVVYTPPDCWISVLRDSLISLLSCVAWIIHLLLYMILISALHHWTLLCAWPVLLREFLCMVWWSVWMASAFKRGNSLDVLLCRGEVVSGNFSTNGDTSVFRSQRHVSHPVTIHVFKFFCVLDCTEANAVSMNWDWIAFF